MLKLPRAKGAAHAAILSSLFAGAPTLAVATTQVRPDSGCESFGKQLATPMQVRLTEIVGPELGGKLIDSLSGEGRRYRVGSLVYGGYGSVAESEDRRFADIMIRPDRYPHHRCGYEIEIGAGAWSVTSAVPERKTHAFKFKQAPGVSFVGPGVTGAAEAGALPVISGHHAGASWPLGDGEFVGLMHPISGQAETLIVRFWAPGRARESEVLARLSVPLQGIGALPDIHSQRWFINVSGKDKSGRLRSLQFWIE